MIPATVIVDASIVVASFSPGEDSYAIARALLQSLTEAGAQIVLPSIGLVEIASGIGRGRRSMPTARRLLARVRQTPGLALVPVEDSLAEDAADAALTRGLKGCDAIYVALARRLMVPLITLDREQQERAPADVEVLLGDAALARWTN